MTNYSTNRVLGFGVYGSMISMHPIADSVILYVFVCRERRDPADDLFILCIIFSSQHRVDDVESRASYLRLTFDLAAELAAELDLGPSTAVERSSVVFVIILF
mmetsp:Transcript_11325/g.22552  ORF Transcript_11325/g.22552 Transcript_11325/m.22552 type:complete len:103 (-) Transcript_11325:19-327(-)